MKNLYPLNQVGKLKQIVLQPTPFCNINCRYCYLPDRNSRNKASFKTIRTLFQQLNDYEKLGNSIEIRWHAGEPLSMPIDFYQEALSIIYKTLKRKVKINHSLQTNAVALNKKWCEFLKQNDFKIGVSIDGTKHIHDRNRVTKHGKGTFDLTYKGINLLRLHEINFETISVLTNYSLDFPDEIYYFLHRLQPTQIGFNIEETEGFNVSISFAQKDFLKRYRQFLFRVSQLEEEKGTTVRELKQIANAILFSEGDRQNLMVNPLSILCMDWEGNLSTFSPELLSFAEYSFGNIHRNKIEDILYHPNFIVANTEIQNGVAKCKTDCDYFEVCGGGAPSNKFWENKTFNSMATTYCSARFKLPTDIVLQKLGQRG